MKKAMKKNKRWRGILAILIGIVLLAGWLQLPEVVYATEVAPPALPDEGTVAPPVSETPAVSEIPSVSEAPSVSEDPSTGEAPSINVPPATSEDPSISAPPATSETPSASEDTSIGDAPVGGDIPSASEDTSIGDAPVGGDTPSVSETPSASEAPPVSEQPSASEAPSQSGGTNKSAGQLTVRVDDYTYSGSAPSVWLNSSTGDIRNAVVMFKVTGTADTTYTTQVPAAAGNYTIRAVLPATNSHTEAVATDTFTVRYLTAPTPAFSLTGVRGDAGWYTTDVKIKPPAGYEMSVGNRSNFSDETYVVSETADGIRLYLKKTDTGEMTDVISIAHLLIDKAVPVLKDIVNGETYYSDHLVIPVVEDNVKSVTVNGKAVTLEEDENGTLVLALTPEAEVAEYEVFISDKAGNEAVYTFKLATESMLEGLVHEGEMTLVPGTKYMFPKGSNWKMSGEEMIYGGGTTFYVKSEKTVQFSKY